MKKNIFLLVIGLFLNLNSFTISHSEWTDINSINDGPYIFKMNGKLIVKWIENNKLKEDYVTSENFTRIRDKFKLLFDFEDLKESSQMKPDFRQSFKKVDSIGIISDVHGEYDIYINLLKGTGIIDRELNWKFGAGHLVVLGDVFDRGDMVTEVLWHLYGLEKQAARAGGMVHFLVGNHELMVLGQNLRYINEKYKKVEEISGTKYSDLYSTYSIMGRWLRSKPIVMTINDIIFTHGGISIEMVQGNLSIADINQIFFNKIIGKSMQEKSDDGLVRFLSGGLGPVWHRGYFKENDFCEERLDSILNYYAKKHIIVGHTSIKEITPLFNRKIIGIDAGISYGEQGAMLMYKSGLFYKCSRTGKRIKL